MYWHWRGFFGVPLEFSVAVRLSDEGSHVRPWAPWWVPSVLMGLIAMVLWRILATRRHTISLWGAGVSIMLTSVLPYMVGIICLEVGAMLQFVPRPPFHKILSVMPLVFAEGFQLIALTLMMGGAVVAIGYAIVGLGLAAAGRVG
jgi:hypothetical protein